MAMLAVLAILAPFNLFAQTSEYLLKANFLFNFVSFTKWPNSVKPSTLCTLGEDPFLSSELTSINQKTGKNLTITRNILFADIEACHILFISTSEADKLPRIMSKIKERPILTIAEFDGFATNGGMIQFLQKNKKISFIVNNRSVKAANLHLSAKLLEVASDVIE